MLPPVTLTEDQLEKFKKLWFIYGNGGPKHTAANHGLVQGFFQYGEDRTDFYVQGIANMAERFGEEYAKKNGVTQECIDACKAVLNER